MVVICAANLSVTALAALWPLLTSPLPNFGRTCRAGSCLRVPLSRRPCCGCIPAQRILLVRRARSAAMSNLSLSSLPSYSSAQSAKQTASLPCTAHDTCMPVNIYAPKTEQVTKKEHYDLGLCTSIAHLCFVYVWLRRLRRKRLMYLVLAPLQTPCIHREKVC